MPKHGLFLCTFLRRLKKCVQQWHQLGEKDSGPAGEDVVGGISKPIGKVTRCSSVSLRNQSGWRKQIIWLPKILESALWVWWTLPKQEIWDRKEGMMWAWRILAMCRAEDQEGVGTDWNHRRGVGGLKRGDWVWVERQGKECQRYSRKKGGDVIKEASFEVGARAGRAQGIAHSPTSCSPPAIRVNCP